MQEDGETTPEPPGAPAPGTTPAEQDQLLGSIARAIAETALEGILAVSLEGQVLFANKRLAEILGLPMGEVYTQGALALLAPAEPQTTARRLAGRRWDAGPERSDLLYLHPDGGQRVLRVSAGGLRTVGGEVFGSLAMVSDVTEQRAAEESLRRQAMHDALTGLPNRLLFVDRLQTAATRQKRVGDGRVAVLFLDLDNFKEINDTHGHETGDRVLAEVASRVAHAVRGTDTVARIGGDEFAVICEGADPKSAALVASRVQQAMEEPVVVDTEPFSVSMSIGLALSPPHGTEDLLRLADTAMYQAKAAGRGSVVTYDADDR
ncbi:MAG TPA: sensor domain-containing diguanylate cyclase [Nocardioidaceae bacterium]|nr:sensor domain-containing diguanylate cyclase [Nocardioidaceae bacterium]